MSPERIAPQRFGFKDGRPTKPSDCYALGMVIYETISGNLPFHKHADINVFLKVVEGERPPRGVRFTTNLWEVLELCWASKPHDRPSAEEVLQCLEVASNSSGPPSSRLDEAEEDGDESDSTTGSSDTPTWTSGLGFPPVRVYTQPGEEAEAETEAEPSAFPFPQSPAPSPIPVQSLFLILDPYTQLPNTSNSHANIYVESISLPRSPPIALYGSVLVRNIAFEKHVTLRFTLDDWETTSEVLCKHVNSLTQLPPPFPRSWTVGDTTGQLAGGFEWDRFGFVIHLDNYEQRLTELDISFVGRFTVIGVGEWWDNNDGMYYRVSIREKRSTL